MARHNRRLYEADHFIYLTAMMKSSSTLIQLVLSAILESNSRPDISKTDDAPANSFLPMTAEFFEQLSRGGVFKNHAPIEYHNNMFLKQSGCKHVILVRHPADHLAAIYCHYRGLEEAGLLRPFYPLDRSTGWSFSVGQYPSGIFKQPANLAIGKLIECGYLFKLLIWATDWAAFRHREQSRLLRYEDVITDFERAVTDLCLFIRGSVPDAYLMDYLLHVFRAVESEGHSKSKLSKYPGGWTGHIGTWRNYFSDTNIDEYNNVVAKFVNVYPQAQSLVELYPGLAVQTPIQSQRPLNVEQATP